MSCPRNFTRDQIVARLKAGRTLMVDRRDAPELADLFELERQGLVTQQLIEIDEQSSALQWRWRDVAEINDAKKRKRHGQSNVV